MAGHLRDAGLAGHGPALLLSLARAPGFCSPGKVFPGLWQQTRCPMEKMARVLAAPWPWGAEHLLCLWQETQRLLLLLLLQAEGAA